MSSIALFLFLIFNKINKKTKANIKFKSTFSFCVLIFRSEQIRPYINSIFLKKYKILLIKIILIK